MSVTGIVRVGVCCFICTSEKSCLVDWSGSTFWFYCYIFYSGVDSRSFKDEQAIDMEPNEYQRLFYFETKHWWFQAQRFIVLNFLHSLTFEKKELDILDAGCGTGYLTKELECFGKVTGVDSHPEAIEFCKERGLKNLYVSRVEDLLFDRGSFDLITAFDLLEHLPDDIQGLKELYRVCRSNGGLFLTVPAYKFLWSKHDIALHHYRRYTRRELTEKLEQVGFRVEKITYFNFILFPLITLRRSLTPSRHKNVQSDLKESWSLTNEILREIFSVESYLVPKIDLPFGVSLLCFCKKNG